MDVSTDFSVTVQCSCCHREHVVSVNAAMLKKGVGARRAAIAVVRALGWEYSYKQGARCDECVVKRLSTKEGDKRPAVFSGRRGPASKVDIAEATRLYASEGWTLEQLCQRYGVSRERVRQKLAQADVEIVESKCRRCFKVLRYLRSDRIANRYCVDCKPIAQEEQREERLYDQCQCGRTKLKAKPHCRRCQASGTHKFNHDEAVVLFTDAKVGGSRIAEYYGVYSGSVYALLAKRGIPRNPVGCANMPRIQWTDEEIRDWLTRYYAKNPKLSSEATPLILCDKCGQHPRMHHRRICHWCHSDDVNQRHHRKSGKTFTPRTKRKRLGLPTLVQTAARFGLTKQQYLEALKS